MPPIAETAAGFVHLHRYAAPKKREEGRVLEVVGPSLVSDAGVLWDLRSASKVGKTAGIAHVLDGRFLEHTAEGLVIVHPDGRRVLAELEHQGRGLHPVHRWLVGPRLVAQDLGNLPLAVVDADTGVRLARIEGPTPVRARPLYLGGEHDVWFVEGASVRRYDVTELRFVEELHAPGGLAILNLVLAPSGDLVALARPESEPSAPPILIRLDRQGRERARGVAEFMAIARVGAHIVASRSDPPRLSLLADDLTIESELTTPSERGWARVIPLPSGREWIAAGTFAEWDHFGEPDLAPVPTRKKR